MAVLSSNGVPGRRKVAVCGIGVRLPSGIRSTDALWDLLVNGRDARTPVPASRYNAAGFDGSLGDKGAIKTGFGYFLDEDLSSFDASFFSMSKDEVGKCDPQQRQLLEVTKECLEDAGEVDYRGRKVGCYVGTFCEDWLRMSARESQHSSGYILGGHVDLMLANRVSYEYDFKGPSVVIKTGCSASLIALHEACRALQNGDATSAVVAGTSLITTPSITAELTAEGILSPNGSCRTFDADADGFARAEAITAVYIKPLEDAIRDGNPIRAVICGTGTNSNGRSASLFSPNGEAQEDLMRDVYASAGLDPRHTAFVECHGTGTRTGDPIETTAVGRVFGGRNEGIYIGSIKPNIGHSEGAAGLSSLVKCVLALEHQTIPPNINMHRPNPRIPFKKYNLRVPAEPTPIPPNRAARVSINSFGLGGANAHAILESFNPTQTNGDSHKHVNGNGHEHVNGHHPTNGNHQVAAPALLVFSANTQTSLEKQIHSHQAFVQQNPDLVSNVAYTRAMGRDRLQHRAYAVAENGQFTVISPAAKSASSPLVNVVFSGQGAQWPGMGKELIETDPAFRECIGTMDTVLQALKHPPSWTIMAELQKPPEDSQMNRAELAQPLSTALQIALFSRFQALGLRPGAVVGHSSGEIAAAYAAGALSLPQAITLAYYRGYVMGKQIDRNGAMAAVGLSEQEVAVYIKSGAGVVVACENSPSSVTISGRSDQVDLVLAAVREGKPDVLARRLKVDMAYHSPDMIFPGREYRRLVEQEWKSLPSTLITAFFSSVSGKLISDPSVLSAPGYWETNLTSPVRFSSAVKELLAHSHGDPFFLEIGPHSTLAGPLRQICAALSKPSKYIASMARGKDSAVTALSAVGELYKEGVHLNLAPLFPPSRKIIAGLPPYPWDRSSSLWYEGRLSKAWRTRKYAHHCLLGARVPETPDNQPQWRNVLRLEHEPWIADHKVNGDVVFPFAGYVAVAGEAVRQMVDGEPGTGYRLRDVVAHAALLVTPSDPVEMVTALQRPRGEAEWFTFSISSFSGSSWVTHCEGQITAVPSPSPSPTPSGSHTVLPRQVDIHRFYDAMAKIGIGYGPEFRPLTNVSASPTACVSAGQIVDPADHRSAPFTLHPAAIDAALQLLIVAQARGLPRNFRQLALPTKIEHLEVHRADTGPIDARASTDNDHSLHSNSVECVMADTARPVLTMTGLHLTPLAAEAEDAVDIHAGARLHWLPHADFVDMAKLFAPPKLNRDVIRLQEEMALLCIMETVDRLEGLVPCQPHFSKFLDWLHKQIECAQAGRLALVENVVGLTGERRLVVLEEQYQKLLGHGKASVAIGMKRVYDNAEALFTGQKEILDVLMEDNVLTGIYNDLSFGYADLIRILSHTKPNLRILEVGAGTGGTTEPIIRALAADDGGPASYFTYTFTDISAGFFPRARERFSYASNMDFKVLDISKDPLEQGFEACSYDLILASNVIHATPSLSASLGHIHQLLGPDGMLVMTELCTTTRAINYIYGNFLGWWLGEADGRPDEPYISIPRWDRELRATGFNGVEIAVYDEDQPYRLSATMLSRKIPPPGPAARYRVSILASHPDQGAPLSLITSLRDRGWDVLPCRSGSPLPEDRDILCCLDMEDNFFEGMTAERFASFQGILRSLKAQHLLWLTNPAQIQCKDPRQAAVIGVARTVRSEASNRFCTLEIDQAEANFVDLVLDVFQKIRRADDDGDRLAADKEYAVHNGVIHVGRYRPFSLTKELAGGPLATTPVEDKVNGVPKQLPAGNSSPPETPEQLESRQQPPDTPVPAGHIEIELRAIGNHELNGHLTPDFHVPASGVVTRVSTDDTIPIHLHPGDHVVVPLTSPSAAKEDNKHPAVGTRVLLPTAGLTLPVRIPPEGHGPTSITHEHAAAMTYPFVTAIHALRNMARLQKGMSVLVHSAALSHRGGDGGVALAALQVCKAVGAETFVTVRGDGGDGVSEEVLQLLEGLGVPRTRVFSAGSFHDGVMRETGGVGVDVVLDLTLTTSDGEPEVRELLWRCVAECGILVELGGAGKVDVCRPPLANRSYCLVDIAQFVKGRPERMERLVQEFLDMYGTGALKPLERTVSATEEVRSTLQHLQHPVLNGDISVGTSQSVRLRPDASYLLVGGVGGLGRCLATWLVERGARHITFLSRSAGVSEQSKDVIRELECMGCSVVAVAGDVSNAADVFSAVRASKTPIAGVLQLAMVLEDSNLFQMTWEGWMAATKPKINGTWNLHRALEGQPLDFFWMSSSLFSAVEHPGQGNYGAANTFMEAFCQYRWSLGLPASVLNICAIDGVGFVAENPRARRKAKSQGVYFLGESEFLDFVELSIQCSAPAGSLHDGPLTAWSNPGQVLMGLRSDSPLDDPANRTNWRRDRRMGLYHNVRANSTAVAPQLDPLRAFLDMLADASNEEEVLTDPSVTQMLAMETGRKIHDLMLKPGELVDISVSLAQLGLDSLVATELRRWLQQAVGLSVSVLEIMRLESLAQLGTLIAVKLRGKQAETRSRNKV